MGNLYIEVGSMQSAKKNGSLCGDLVSAVRTPYATTLIVADGLGSGCRAHLSATMYVARMSRLLQLGFSFRQAFSRIIETLHAVRGGDSPYTALTAVNILNDGVATVLSYEMPPPVWIGYRLASPVVLRSIISNNAVFAEGYAQLEPGEGILVVSDGITQSGIGLGRGDGWGIDGVVKFLNDHLSQGVGWRQLPGLVHLQARRNWGEHSGDDCTVSMALARHEVAVKIVTGPPLDRHQDISVIQNLLEFEGERVICGATTAKIAARCVGKNLRVQQGKIPAWAPPRYYLEGFDVVTEGAITLNQVYNMWEEELEGQTPESIEENSSLLLLHLLKQADRVLFTVGMAANPANEHLSFQQVGLMKRKEIVYLLSEKLRASGKIVTIEFV